jgi:Helix-turn-helix domain
MKLQNVMNSPPRREVRPKQAAEMIGCSVGFIYQLMNDGQLAHRSITRRGKERGIRLISVASIEKFLSQEATV